jgi:hypothetical protein
LEDTVVNRWVRQIRKLPVYALAVWMVLPASAMQVVTVSIDLRPDDPPPTLVAPRAEGRLPVGILTTDSFDATTIATATLRLGPTGKEAPPLRVNRADLNKDGRTDLQVFFSVPEMGVKCTDKRLILRGQTMSGQEIEGSEAIVTDGC